MIRRRVLLVAPLFALLFALGGCAPLEREPTARPDAPAHVPGVDAQEAGALAARGEHVAAARAWLRAAEAEPDQAGRYQLEAAEALLAASDPAGALRVLNGIAADRLSPAAQVRWRVAGAHAALATRDHVEARRWVNPEPSAEASADLRARYFELRGRAALLAGAVIPATQAWIAREPLLIEPRAVRANQEQIWRALARLPEEELRAAAHRFYPPLRGWMELVHLAKTYEHDRTRVRDRVLEWRTSHPDHPAHDDFLQAILARHQEAVRHPEQIALLVPLSGRLASAGNAVREGLFAAYYRLPVEERPRVRVYDTGGGAATIAPLYRRAVDEGAQFVVGPLDRDTLATLVRTTRLGVPTLALNVLDSHAGATQPNLYQFGLPPEEEARQVAERAWVDGHMHALAFYPEGDLGQRLYHAFAARWAELGGVLLHAETYDAEQSDYSVVLRRALQLDASRQRHRELEQLLRTDLQFNPRRRQDADFVFLAATPRSGRLMRPQLRFHHAAELPVYATSHVFGGQPEPEADRDMDGIIFSEMPWILAGARGSGADALGRPPEQMTGALQRLYALGADAFDLVARVKPLQSYSFERHAGYTGSLRVDEQQRVRRQVAWARFHRGVARLIETEAVRAEPQAEAQPLLPE